MQQLVLSLFPGIDMLGRGFEAEGYCVVRGPDVLWGGDIRLFHPPPMKFHGVIGGSPCQDFSKARRIPPTGYGLEMIAEFERVVGESSPLWWLLENVPGVPDISVDGYEVQRLDLNARECGLSQRRLRHFQFGSMFGDMLIPKRQKNFSEPTPTLLASDGKKSSRLGWPDFCEESGLPRNFALPGLSRKQRYAAVGNGVPIPMARTIANAIKWRVTKGTANLCICGCGRVVTGNQKAAGAACRKRMERRRRKKENNST